jgi:heptosyltransferase-1
MGLAQVMDAMALTEGVIGVDSGLSHMAVALDLPHVQIFSQPRAWRAGPVGRAHQVAVGGDFVPDVDAVWNAWRAVS